MESDRDFQQQMLGTVYRWWNTRYLPYPFVRQWRPSKAFNMVEGGVLIYDSKGEVPDVQPHSGHYV